MAHYKSFEDLEIYQLSRELCQDIWKLIAETTLSKDYKLREQISKFMNYLKSSKRKGSKYD